MNKSGKISVRARTVKAVLWVVLGVLGLSGEVSSVARAQMANDKPLGRLDWGTDPATGVAWTQASLGREFKFGNDAALLLGNATAKAWMDSGKRFPTVEHIAIEGHLPGQPAFEQSIAAGHQMKTLVPLALCARGGVAGLSGPCQRAASEGVFDWMRAYAAPTGNPIDESSMLPLLLATDLLEDTWSAPQKAEAARWLEKFLDSSEHFRQKQLAETVGVPYGNFESWRLMLSLMAATVAGKDQDVQRLTLLWHRQLALNVGQDGRTFDLRRRGSLHYQNYDLEPMIWVRLFVPAAYTEKENRLVLGGVMYLKPYYQGTKTYIEFEHPDPLLGHPVAFDGTRRDAGIKEFQLKNWNPSDAHLMLHLAAIVYPTVEQWVVGDNPNAYPVMIREIVAMRVRNDEGCANCGGPLR